MNADPQAPPPRNTTPIKVAVACCGCLTIAAVLTVFGIVTVFRSGSQAVSESREKADRFLTLMEQHDFKSARAALSRDTQRNTTVEKLADLMAMVEKQHGKSDGHSPAPSFFINTYNGVTQVQLSYGLRFEKGVSTAQIVVVREGDSWRVKSFNYQL